MIKVCLTRGQLTEEIVTEYADIVDWWYLSKEINIPDFSDKFFIKFKNEIDWLIIVRNKSMTPHFFKTFKKQLNSKTKFLNNKWYPYSVYQELLHNYLYEEDKT